jgi:hypothetical protein
MCAVRAVLFYFHTDMSIKVGKPYERRSKRSHRGMNDAGSRKLICKELSRGATHLPNL